MELAYVKIEWWGIFAVFLIVKDVFLATFVMLGGYFGWYFKYC